MKPTTCGSWVHITCAMWIPEMAFENVETMEPISGVQRALPDRSKLKCEVRACRVLVAACVLCVCACVLQRGPLEPLAPFACELGKSFQ